MTEKQVSINGSFEYEDHYQMEFKYFGTYEQGASNKTKEELEQTIKNVFSKKETEPFSYLKTHSSILETTTYLKTILRDLKEIRLDIYVGKKQEVSHSVQYVNGVLNIFQYHKLKSLTNLTEIEMEYSPKKGTKFSFSSGAGTDSNSIFRNEINEEFHYETFVLSKLQNMTPQKLNNKQKELYEIYRLFFNETPDFSDKITQKKAEDMIICLKLFEIDINMDAKIFLGCYPNFIETLSHFGKISESLSCENLTQKIKKEIQTIGEEIRNYTNTTIIPSEILEDIVKLERARISSNLSLEVLNSLPTRGKTLQRTLDEHSKLVKQIKNKL